MSGELDLKSHIRTVPDFPVPGIRFRDITPLLASPEAYSEVIRRLADSYREGGVDVVASVEARGFLFGAPLALELGARFVPVRKPGKLPHETRSYSYQLEYGEDTLEVHTDAVKAGDRVLMVDDLLATGGTVAACQRLLEEAGAEVLGCAVVIELLGLGGREALAGCCVTTLMTFSEDE
jgi:adenine phosphoribosyltransferase